MRSRTGRSEELFERAKKFLVRGVASSAPRAEYAKYPIGTEANMLSFPDYIAASMRSITTSCISP